MYDTQTQTSRTPAKRLNSSFSVCGTHERLLLCTAVFRKETRVRRASGGFLVLSRCIRYTQTNVNFSLKSFQPAVCAAYVHRT